MEAHCTHQQTLSGNIHFKNFQIYVSFELAGRNVQFELINSIYYSFHVRRHCQGEESNTALMKLAWLKRSACTQHHIVKLTITKNGDGVPLSVASTSSLSQKMATEFGFASKAFPAEKNQRLLLQFGYGDESFQSRRYNQSFVAEATS